MPISKEKKIKKRNGEKDEVVYAKIIETIQQFTSHHFRKLLIIKYESIKIYENYCYQLLNKK